MHPIFSSVSVVSITHLVDKVAVRFVVVEQAKQDEQLRDFQRNNKRATEEDINGAGRAFPTPKRYQRKAEAWGSLDFVSRMAEADREKHEKLDEVRREKLAAQQAEEEKHLVHARKIVATKEEAEEIAERLFRWEAEKQNVLNDVRQEIEETQRIEPKPRFDSASRSLIDSFDTRVPVTDRLLHWREVHNEELEQKRVQTLAEAETELTFQPKLGKTAQHVRSNRPLSKDNVFETLYDTASSHASKFKTADCNKAKGASETARVELRAELEGLTVSLLKKRAAAAGVSVDAMLAAMQAAVRCEILRLPVAFLILLSILKQRCCCCDCRRTLGYHDTQPVASTAGKVQSSMLLRRRMP